MRKIGLLAGEGMLPVIWANSAHRQNIQIITIGLTPETEEILLGQLSTTYYSISVGQLELIIKTLLAEGVTETVMMGKVSKICLYQDMEMDSRLNHLLTRLPVKNDDSILLALVEEFAHEGITFLNQSTFMEDFLVEEGLITPILEPTSDVLRDMEFGFKIAKEIGRLDIGQTVVVKDGAVIAVEAIEGTDEALARSGGLTLGAVVAKVSKPQQDFRFDLPTVGLTTLKNLVSIQAKGLVLEAGSTFLIQRNEVVRLAQENGIAIVAMR